MPIRLSAKSKALNKQLLLISTSKIHGSDYLAYLHETLDHYLSDCRELIFVPFARPGGISHDDYTQLPQRALAPLDVEVRGLHRFNNPSEAIRNAPAVFIGGGNTFLLLKSLYALELLEPIREAVAQGTRYLGSSAGSNVAGLTIGTTNDMPIVYPPSFEALALVDFNINPHYLDPLSNSRHMGETRETRIGEFHHFNSQPVLGLREGSWLEVNGNQLTLGGELSARLFRSGQQAEELPPGPLKAFG